jgi:polyisoprenyl-phosphate glycosyltransferase
MKKRITVVIPILNEFESIKPLSNKLLQVTKDQPKYLFNFIFVDDGSETKNINLLKQICKINKSFQLLVLSRNFGKEFALTAGIHHAPECNALITMDADLQHPPELIHELIKLWEIGSKVVVCKRVHNEDNSFFRKLCSTFFYKISNLISTVKINPNTTDFRLLDSFVISHFKKFNETPMMYKRIIDWMGFKESIIEFKAPKRLNDKSSFTYTSLLNLAVNALTTYSIKPLKIIFISGVVMTFSSLLIFLWMFFYNFYISSLMFTTLAFFVVLNTFLMGIVLIALGLVGIYIGNIYSQVLNRPLYIIEEKINFDKN